MKQVYWVAILNAVVIGFSFLLVKQTLDYAAPLDTLTYRFAAAFAIMLPIAVSRFAKFNYRGKPLYLLLALVLLYPVGFFILQTFGLQNATSAEGGIISAFTPIVTMMLASFCLKEKTTMVQKLSLLLSAVGVTFIFIMKGSSIDLSQLSGIGLLLLSCVSFAGYSVLARLTARRFTVFEISFFMVIAAFASLLSISLATHASAGTLDTFTAPILSSSFLLLIACLGAIQCATAFMASFILARMEASKASVFAHLSTVVSIAAGVLLLQETIAWYHLLGSALIIAGVIGTNMNAKRPAAFQLHSRRLSEERNMHKSSQ